MMYQLCHQMKRVAWLRGVLTFMGLFLLLTTSLHAQEWMLNDGGRSLGGVPARSAGRATLVAFDRMTHLMGAPGSVVDGDFRVSEGGHTLLLIGDSAAAWLDSVLVALPNTNRASEGHYWVDSVAALRLLSDFLKKTGRSSALVWGGAAVGQPGSVATTPVAKPEPVELKPVVPRPIVIDPVAVKPDPVVKAGAIDSDLPELKALRWGVTRDKIRVVADIAGGGTPLVGTPEGKVFLKVAPMNPKVLQSISSPVEEVTVQVKNEAAGEVALFFPGLKATVVHLENPRRVVVDILRQPLSSDKEAKGLAPDVTAAGKPQTGLHGKPPEKHERPIVVVDAGHGGKDPGASRGQHKEKVIALQIAKVLQAELTSRKFDVRMTRAGDSYPTLKERPALANSVNADLFISIHLNALPAGRKAKGVEIYFMALPTDKDAMELARIENAELLEDGVVDDSKTDMLMSILGNLQQNAKITESTSLAEALFAAGKKRGLTMRRVAQAPFAVLRGAAMPSVLVETGFISDPQEVKLLASAAYQKKMAAALADGIEKFLR